MKSFFITRRMIAVMLFMLTLSVYFSVNYTTAINMPKTSAAKANKRVPLEYNNFYNASALNPFFEKLVALDTFHDRKINIVHIGDSHIQADVMTNVMRVRLQEVFGNAGLGLVFPYSLIKTNGGKNVSFTSNIAWNGEKNSDLSGISGYALSTNKKNFVIELNLKNKDYAFNTLKIITPDNQRLFELATNVGKITTLTPSAPKSISHKVTKGETLYAISRKYHITVAQVQKANGLRSNNIRIGQVLHIPTKGKTTPPDTKVDMSNATILNGNSLYSYYAYDSLDVSDKIYLTPNAQSTSFTLNGIVLENNHNGIIYHTIGVNGAHFSDYNKSSRFFEQIKALSPDLIVISLGTNETFGRMSAERYDAEVTKFIETIRSSYGQCPILLTTPPPSLYKKKNPNPLCMEYANTLIDNSVKANYGVFDLYRALGGNEAMTRFIQEKLIADDRVHYTRDGYLEQGSLFYDALMSNYKNYKQQIKFPLKPYLN
ncbi:LysM peptidoglycan-binding domain-containing protein [Capnocytophaga sp. oral taxon 878]|uniref:LysM peptidoglycan-binding domain-containing protein n=1 Tax=Capnocytophaga sp. oral taxon 878 TaxID=1316596 RepID=UPI0026D5215E